jgi:hypothetical protein
VRSLSDGRIGWPVMPLRFTAEGLGDGPRSKGFMPGWEAAELLGCSESEVEWRARQGYLEAAPSDYGMLVKPAVTTMLAVDDGRAS